MRLQLVSWLRSERGNIAIMFALMLPLVIGGAAFGVETSAWYQARLKLQEQADAAAYAGVQDKKSGADIATITTAATKAAADNGFVTADGTITVNTPPTSGTSGPNAVEVILTATTPRFFTAIFTTTPVNIQARAVAKYLESGSACVLAMNKTASKAANFGGSSNMTLQGCSVMSNSSAADAVAMTGNAAHLTSDCIYSVGGVNLNSHVALSCASAVTGTGVASDPFGSLPVPTDASACKTVSGSTLEPGNYCSGFSLNGGTTNLNPGTYIISGGDFKINGNATLNGTGVTFYIKSGTNITINGTSTVNLSAPTSGTYSGMLFFGERSNTAKQKFNGTDTSHLTGHIYFAGGEVDYQGNFSGVDGCTQVVADTVEWTGNSTMSVDCTGHGMKKIPAATFARLSE